MYHLLDLPPVMLGVLLIDSEMKVTLFRSFRHCYVLVIISAVQCHALCFQQTWGLSSEVHALQYCRTIPFSKDANQIFIIYVPLSGSLVRYSAPRGFFSRFPSFPLCPQINNQSDAGPPWKPLNHEDNFLLIFCFSFIFYLRSLLDLHFLDWWF